MTALLDRANRLIERAKVRGILLRQKSDDTRYRDDPCAYATDILHANWWSKQQEVARLLCTPPYRVLVRASHEVGKTHLAGGLVNWWYDTRAPGLCLTTAPTDAQVRDLLWKEVRVQRRKAGRGGFRGPKMPRLESNEDHWAHGFTARDADSFQGRHEAAVLIIFDEGVGVQPEFWDAAETMRTSMLAIYNPTDVGSRAYAEERSGRWHVVEMSGLEHPNVVAELAGQPPPFPAALRLERLQERLDRWCTPVAPGEQPLSTDIEWPPQSGKWLRPGPIAESRVLGRWPSRAVNSVWSEFAWSMAESLLLPEQRDQPEIGCDVARFGDDFTEMHVRRGGASLHHEAHNGWSTTQTAARLRMMADEWGSKANLERFRVRVKVDDEGVGGGVTDQRGDYNFIPVRASSVAMAPNDFPNLRSQLWFNVADAAAAKRISLARLPAETRQELRRQAFAPTYTLDWQGRRVVEKKDETKKRIKRSPDGMDALNLAYLNVRSREDGE